MGLIIKVMVKARKPPVSRCPNVIFAMKDIIFLFFGKNGTHFVADLKFISQLV